MRFDSREELTKWALEAEQLWLILDYDGTLADFAPTPDHIESSPELTDLLERLARKSGVRVTILSGRRLAHIRELLPVKGLIMAGSYGIEVLGENGEPMYRVPFEDIRPALDVIKPQWQELIHGRKGFFLEDKDWTLAVHARFADEEEAEEILARARDIAASTVSADHFRILGGHRFLEVAPQLANKREAVIDLLSQYPLPDARLLYIGDDDKDEEAFSVIHAQEGVAVKVRQPSQVAHKTSADFFFDSPKETRDWLEQLTAEVAR